MEINISYILLLFLNMMINLSFFVLAVVYFFLEAIRSTRIQYQRAAMLSGVIAVVGAVTVVMTRYLIEFPVIENYDMSSTLNFLIGMGSVFFGFFTFILYLLCGECFTHRHALPGSSFLKGRFREEAVDWKLLMIPMPFLILWTFLWFGLFTPQPTELLQATTPKDDNAITVLYMLLSASILAPIKEEILYRHFVMGLFYRWFGTSRTAVIMNIILSALLFSVAHMAILTDDWVKILQIFPAGLAFGWIYHKRGLEHSVMAHGIFNTLVIPISYALEYFAA